MSSKPEWANDSDEKIVSEAEKRGLTREQAIAHGRMLAEHENERLALRRPDYTQQHRKDRIARAEAYAAWEYNGRAAGTIGRVESGRVDPTIHPVPDTGTARSDEVVT